MTRNHFWSTSISTMFKKRIRLSNRFCKLLLLRFVDLQWFYPTKGYIFRSVKFWKGSNEWIAKSWCLYRIWWTGQQQSLHCDIQSGSAPRINEWEVSPIHHIPLCRYSFDLPKECIFIRRESIDQSQIVHVEKRNCRIFFVLFFLFSPSSRDWVESGDEVME
jgi:hypothetical protein